MSPTPDPDKLRNDFLAEESTLSTSGVGRLARTMRSVAKGALRVGRMKPAADGGLRDKDQAALEQLVRSLGELKGLPMKLGQMLGYVDESLPEEMRRLLSTLQTHAPAVPFSEIEQTIRENLGERADELLPRLTRTPVAAASIGQVHRATLPDGTPVAVKVQYKGIEAALRAEFDLARFGVRYATLLAPGDVQSFVEEVRTQLLYECDYVREAGWQERFAEVFADHPVVRVPTVHRAYCGRRVLTTTWMEGRRFDDWLAGNPSQAERNRIGVTLYECYLGTLYRHGLFNADPHPGNYLFGDDGSLIMLDFGCVRSFPPELVASFVALRRAVQGDDRREICAALAAIGARPPVKDKAYDAARDLLRAFFAPVLVPGVQRISPATGTRLGELLADKMSLLKLSLPGEIAFLFRIKFGLYSLLSRVEAEADWAGLEASWSADLKS